MLSELRDKRLIWLANEKLADKNSIKTGYESFDQHYGGLPADGLIEIQTKPGWGEIRFLLSYLKHKQDQGMTAIVQPPGILSAEFLLQNRFKLDQILLITPNSEPDALWAVEQCLKSGLCSSVLLWGEHLDFHQVRRLNLACEKEHASMLIIRGVQEHLIPGSRMSIQLQPVDDGLMIRVRRRKGCSLHINPTIEFQELWQSQFSPYDKRAPLKSATFQRLMLNELDLLVFS